MSRCTDALYLHDCVMLERQSYVSTDCHKRYLSIDCNWYIDKRSLSIDCNWYIDKRSLSIGWH